MSTRASSGGEGGGFAPVGRVTGWGESVETHKDRECLEVLPVHSTSQNTISAQAQAQAQTDFGSDFLR